MPGIVESFQSLEWVPAFILINCVAFDKSFNVSELAVSTIRQGE